MACHCVIGELLTTHPVADGDVYYETLDYWLGRCLPTMPPQWIADHRGSTPLEPHLWRQDARTDNGWLQNARRDEVLSELGVLNSSKPGWLVVDGQYSARFPKRHMDVKISTALVSPKTAIPLVRALQTASNPWDFRIPNEDDDAELHSSAYQLTGWIANIESDMRFDEHDPLRYEVGQARVQPGRNLSKMLDLVPRADGRRFWVCKETQEMVLMYEAWCDEPSPEDDRYTQNIRSDGWRLWARADIVQAYLVKRCLDLICEVQIERRLRNEFGRSYESDAKKRTHEKILLLRASGVIEDAEKPIGAWTDTRKGATHRSRGGYARKMDGASHRRTYRGSRSRP
jgi:hypothetical protein